MDLQERSTTNLRRRRQGFSHSLRSWLSNLRCWQGRSEATRSDEALHHFLCLVQGFGSRREIRETLVAQAGCIARAQRVELWLSETPGCDPRQVACWTETDTDADPDWRSSPLTDDRTQNARARVDRGAPSAIQLDLRLAGRSWGYLRVCARRRHAPGRILRRLETLATLAAAAEAAGERRAGNTTTHDPVTGVLNEPFLDAYLTHALALARRRGEPLTLLAIEVDDLAKARARHGVELTDAALRRLARAISGTLRASDVVARLAQGDGRFVAVLPGAAAVDAPRVAAAVRRAIAEIGTASGLTPPLTATITTATYPDDADNPAELRLLSADTPAVVA